MSPGQPRGFFYILFVKIKFQKRSAWTPIIIGAKLNNHAEGGGFHTRDCKS